MENDQTLKSSLTFAGPARAARPATAPVRYVAPSTEEALGTLRAESCYRWQRIAIDAGLTLAAGVLFVMGFIVTIWLRHADALAVVALIWGAVLLGSAILVAVRQALVVLVDMGDAQIRRGAREMD